MSGLPLQADLRTSSPLVSEVPNRTQLGSRSGNIVLYRTGVEDGIGGVQMNDDASGRKARAKTQFNTVAAEYDAGPGCFAHFGRRLVSAAKI